MPLLVKRLLLPVILSLLVSSCLVDGGKPLKSYAITLPAQLRHYVGGEWMEYVIIGHWQQKGVGEQTGLSGTMRIDWSNDVITNPTTLQTINVLRKTTTITVDDTENSIVQFFTQRAATEEDAGSLYLQAVMGTGKDDLYWVETDISGDTPEALKILWSPFETEATGIDIADHSYEHDVIGSCNQVGCTPVGRLDMGVMQYLPSRENSVETQYGYFDTYRMIYDISYSPVSSISAAIDPRLWCGAGADKSVESHNSYYNFHPEIGIVRMNNYCNNGSYTVYINATLSDTNIELTSAQ